MSMTINQPSTVDEAGFAVRRTIRIAAPVAKVWAAVTEPALISQWFGHVELAGTAGTISWPDRAPIPLRVEQLDEPHLVASDPAANMADHATGWVSELDKLVALLEGSA